MKNGLEKSLMLMKIQQIKNLIQEKKKDKNLTKEEKLDLYFKDKIFDKEDLAPEELDDLLSSEEEWDDYE